MAGSATTLRVIRRNPVHRSRLSSAALKRFKRLFQELTTHFFLGLSRYRGIADDVNNSISEHGTVGADHLGDRQRRGNLNGWNTGLFKFRGDRSAAACAGSSSRGENDRIDTETFGFVGHLASHPPGVRQRIG